MGSNNSTLNPNGAEAFPARVRPILIRRLEEFKKRRNINGGTLRGGGGEGEEDAISRKQLLKDDGGGAEEEDENTQSSHSHHDNDEPVVRVEKLSKVVPLPVSECGVEEKQHEEHKDLDQEKVKDVKPQTENKHEDAKDDDDDDDDDDGDDDDDDYDQIGRLIGPGPGSPSFRIYCIEVEKKKEEQEPEKRTVAIMHHKTPSADSDESIDAPASGNKWNEPVEILESTSKRKGHKMKKFMMMKKNLLNVKNLQIKHRMNPMFSCSGNDNRKSRFSPN